MLVHASRPDTPVTCTYKRSEPCAGVAGRQKKQRHVLLKCYTCLSVTHVADSLHASRPNRSVRYTHKPSESCGGVARYAEIAVARAADVLLMLKCDTCR